MEYYNELVSYLKKYTNKKIGMNDNLFDIGLLNSLFIMQLIGYIEAKFHIKIENNEITRENFKSIKQIESLILKKEMKEEKEE